MSFVSAATEIIFALGPQAIDSLVGVTSLCEEPSQAQAAPRKIICRSFIDASTMTSEQVDAAMQNMKQKISSQKQPKSNDGEDGGEGDIMSNSKLTGPGIWKVDHALLKELDPQVVFVQNTCEICDPSLDDVLLALRQTGLMKKTENQGETQHSECKTVSVAPTTLDGLFRAIQDIAQALGLHEQGEILTNSLRARLTRVSDELAKQHRNDGNKEEYDSPPRLLSLEGLCPPCTGGNWLPDMKVAAGCQDALGDHGGAKARILTWEEIEASDPDALLLSPCSGTPQRTFQELHLLASEPTFWRLRCVRHGDVYVLDHGRFSRPGPRLVSGVEMLATLFRGIPAPPGAKEEWAKEAFKYECSVNESVKHYASQKGTSCGTNNRHCTTELAHRFKPCFPKASTEDSVDKVDGQSTKQLKHEICRPHKYSVTRCTIPHHPHPASRSAHCMVPFMRAGNLRPSFLIFAGEDASGARINDSWILDAPTKGWWMANSEESPTAEELGTTCTWEWLNCSKVANEDVPTIRSNSAAIICNNFLLVFGGWGEDNVTPLSACELLHLETLCWTHCSVRGDIEPPPRGNPTLVYSEKYNFVFLFGGWNRTRRLSDLWCLDLNTWEWTQITEKDDGAVWPKARTDHSAVMVETSDGGEAMMVYGGSVDGTGACSELWALYDCKPAAKGGTWRWQKLEIPGPQPSGRSSHTAAIVGSGRNASMIVVGGTNALEGCGKTGIVGDAWLLENVGGQETEMDWRQLDWNGSGVERCRHGMVCVGGDVVIWGGFDGEQTVCDNISVWHASVKEAGGSNDDKKGASPSPENSTKRRVQERWQAEVPVRVEDLPTDILEKAKESKLPGAIAKALHRFAVSIGRDTYIDPESGYSVFTQLYLERRPCCGKNEIFLFGLCFLLFFNLDLLTSIPCVLLCCYDQEMDAGTVPTDTSMYLKRKSLSGKVTASQSCFDKPQWP